MGRAEAARHWIAILIGLSLLISSSSVIAVDRDVARAHQSTADQLFNSGAFEQAIDEYKKALILYENFAFPGDAAVVRHQLGFSYWGLRDTHNATAIFAANRDFHARRGDTRSAANYSQYIGQLLLEEGAYDEALTNLNAARDQLKSNAERLAEVDHWRVLAYERSGDSDTARRILTESLALFQSEIWHRYLAVDAARYGIAFKMPNTEQSNNQRVYALLGVTLAIAILSILYKLGYLGVRFRNATLVGVSVIIALALSEALLRVALPKPPAISHLLHTPNQVTRFFPAPGVMIGVDNKETHFTINDAGLRGDPVPTDSSIKRVLAIGGSSTEALFLDDPDGWPYVLQTLLSQATGKKVWVGNAGKSGLNSFSHVVQFYYYKDELRPDVVIVNAGINDLNQCISGGLGAIRDNAKFIQRPGFFDEYQKYVFQEIRPIKERSPWRLAEVINRAKLAFDNKNSPANDIQFDYVIQDQAGLFYDEQRRRRQVATKVHQVPDISPCIAAFRYNLERIADMAQESNIRLVFVTQGSLYRDDLSSQEEGLLWFGSVEKNPFAETPPTSYYSAKTMGQLLDQYNAQTLALCVARLLQCVDTDALVAQTTNSYYDDVHLNVGGARAVAKMLADVLLTQGIIGR